MRIPEEKITEVRDASGIVDVVSQYVRLRKRGKSYLGLCPFHQEKTPSFTVSQERQMYHCFGCGKGGNVFTFVMEMEKVSFPEAVRSLAERSGIVLGREEAGGDSSEAEALYQACRLAAARFQENLLHSAEGKLGLEYFRHRGFLDETVRVFGLGYALNGWDDLIRHAAAGGLGSDVLERAGLAVRREDGSGWYDRFRGRAMFPVFSPSGRVIGFGARKLREDDPLAGKYINSPETPLYVKSRVLYGLFQARDAIREQDTALLVEGYTDLLSLYQEGIRNTVAAGGTALTEEQVRLLARYAREIVLVYDADSAGFGAALRGLDLIIEGGLGVRIAQLPPGEDPDSFVRSAGAGRLKELVDGSVSFLDFKAGAFARQGLLDTPEGRTQAVRSIVGTIARMRDEVQRNFYIQHLAGRYGIHEAVLHRELERQMGERSQARTDVPSFRSPGPIPSDSPDPPPGPAGPVPAVERDLLRLMLEQGSSMAVFVFAEADIGAFTHPAARGLAELLQRKTREDSPWNTGSLMDELENGGQREFLAELLFARHDLSHGWTALGGEPREPDPWEWARRCLDILRKREVESLLARNQALMRQAAARGEPTRPFLERHRELVDEKSAIERRLRSGEGERPAEGEGTEGEDAGGE
ncbi:MAG: DNA primase [Bacteroidota bacterium]